MSTYNAGVFLRDAVESVLAQVEEDWLLVVVDDASTDGTADLVSQYVDPRITLVALRRNVGQTAALNFGLERVRTPWVARLDQDDVAMPDRLATQLQYVAANPQTVLLGSWAEFIDESGNVIGRWRPRTAPDDVRRDLYVRSCPLVHSSVLYRADVARMLGGYPTDYAYAQDLALWIAMERAGAVAIVPKVLTCLRRHETQTSRDPRALVQQLGEALRATADLPLEFKHDRATLHAWEGRRLRLHIERAYVAVRAARWRVACESARDAVRLTVMNPLAALWVFRAAWTRIAQGFVRVNS